MAGTKEGALKASATKLKKNPNFYADIGRKGGQVKGKKGFAVDKRTWWQRLLRKKKLASLAGAKGGRISKKGAK